MAPNVDGLSIGDLTGYPLHNFYFGLDAQDTTNYGYYDVKITDGGNQGIDEGQNYTYTINIWGTGPFLDTYFSEQANQASYLAALDIKNGGSGEAGVVTTYEPAGTGEPVPEPSTLLLLGSARSIRPYGSSKETGRVIKKPRMTQG